MRRFLITAFLCLAPSLALAQFYAPDQRMQPGEIVTLIKPQTLQNKSISGTLNTLTNIGLSSLASITANTVIGNGTGSSASPTALPVPSCSGASNALTWTSGTGFGCNTISGSGSPGGSNTDVQYNNSSAFGGNSGFTYNGTSQITLGVSGTSVGSVLLNNATSGSITLSPTTGALGTVTATLPANTGTISELNLAQTWSAAQTFNNAELLMAGSTSGTTTLEASATAGTTTATFPDNTGTVAELNLQQSFTEGQGTTSSALTDGSSISVNAALSNVFTLTLSGSGHTLANPTNLISGQPLTFVVTQAASGGPYTLAYGADYNFISGAVPVINTTASSKTTISCVADTSSTLQCAGGAATPVTSSVASPGSSISNATSTNITSITLPAGTWLVYGSVCFLPAATTTTTALYAWTSATSATIPTLPNAGAFVGFYASFGVGANDLCIPTGNQRVSITSSETFYLTGFASFGTSTMTAFGYLEADWMP